MPVRVLWILIFLIFGSCQEEKTKPAPSAPPPAPVPQTPPAAPPKTETDFSAPCQKLAAKLAQCKKEIIQQEFTSPADAVIAACKKTLGTEVERSDTSLKLMDLLQEKAEPNSCRGSVNADCSTFVSCLVTRRRSEVCHPSRTATIRISAQEILLNEKTVVFLAGTRIAGQPEDADEIEPLARQAAELKNSGISAACINADPDVPWTVVDRVSRTARSAGLTKQALISQQLTPEKAGALLETAAEPSAWTLPEDLLPWGIPGSVTGSPAPDAVTVRVTVDGYEVLVNRKSLCPAQNRRKKPCIPRVTVDGQTVHNPVALRQFLYEYHVLPFWKAQNARPGEKLPPAGEVYLSVADPSLPYKVVTSTLDGLRHLPANAQKDWATSGSCRLEKDWMAQGRVEQFSGACLYPAVYVASNENAGGVPDGGTEEPAAPQLHPVQGGSVMDPDTPAPMISTPAMLEAPQGPGGIGATDKGLVPPGAPLEVRQWLSQKKWAIVACFQKAGARGFTHQGTVAVTMEMSQGTARVLSMGGSLAAIPSFLQCTRDTLHQKNVGASEDTRAFQARWTFTLQLKGAVSE